MLFTEPETEFIGLLAQGLNRQEICRAMQIDHEQYWTFWNRVSDKAEVVDDPVDNNIASLLAFERSRAAALSAQLFASEARLRALMEISPQAILIADGHSGKILQVNDAAIRLFGYQRAELIGMIVEEFVPPDQRDLHLKQRTGFLRSIRKREIGYHPEIIALTKDGLRVNLSIGLTATPTTDDVMVVCTPC